MRSPWRYRPTFVHATAKAIRANPAPHKPSAPYLTTYPYPLERPTPSLVIARLLEILLPLLLHLLLIILFLLPNSSRCARAAIIRSLHPLPFPRQRDLNLRKDPDQSVELFNGKRDALFHPVVSIHSMEKHTPSHHQPNKTQPFETQKNP